MVGTRLTGQFHQWTMEKDVSINFSRHVIYFSTCFHNGRFGTNSHRQLELSIILRFCHLVISNLTLKQKNKGLSYIVQAGNLGKLLLQELQLSN